MPASTHHPPPAPDPRLWRYALDGGWLVRVGRTDRDNDLLSLELAAPNDCWFHVKGLPGSHVLLSHPDEPGRPPPPAILRQAAAIAAYHSKARNAGLTPVHYTQARHVGKPRGAKPGTVHIQNEKLLKVRPALPPGTEGARNE